MINKATLHTLTILVVSGCIYFVIYNTIPMDVYLAPGWEFKGSSGVILLSTFTLGFLLSSFLASYFAIKGKLREKKYERKEKKWKKFHEGLKQARTLSLTEQWDKASSAWQGMIKKDPTDTVARLEYAKSLQNQGKLRDALKVLDEARNRDRENVEILFHAAKINRELGNRTAAIDNLALVIALEPNIVAAREARNLSEELNRIGDALEYQSQVERFGASDKDLKEDKPRLLYKQLVRSFQEDPDKTEVRLVKELRQLTRNYPSFAPAFAHLAEFEVKAGRIEKGAELLMKAGSLSGDLAHWAEASRLWIENGQTDKALAAARAALKNAKGEDRIRGELYLASLYLKLDNLDEAKTILEGIQQLSNSEGVSLRGELKRQKLSLEGFCLHSLGEYQDAANIWQELSDQSSEPTDAEDFLNVVPLALPNS